MPGVHEQSLRLSKDLESLEKVSLSMPEKDVLRFIRRELGRIIEISASIDSELESKNWVGATKDFVKLAERANLLLAAMTQPAIAPTLISGNLSEKMDNIMDFLVSAITEYLFAIKSNMKEVGIESITANLSASPPAINISMVIKSAQ
jgi:hypothetical protein